MATTKNLEMKENPSIVDEGQSTTRLVTKSDGSKVPFSDEHLKTALREQLQGLSELINVDIILSKVSSGLYNGKSGSRQATLTCLAVVAFTSPSIDPNGLPHLGTARIIWNLVH